MSTTSIIRWTAIVSTALTGCATAEESSSAWSLGVDEEVTWETVHVLSQTSADAVLDETGSKEVNPILSFRCTEGTGEISLQIDWQRFISSFNTEAGFQVDEGSRNWIKLGMDSSDRVTLARSASDVVSLIAAMSDGRSLSVEIPPYSEPSIFAGFDLGGFATSISDLQENCN